MRRVVAWSDRGLHYLECGHYIPLRFTAYGMALDQKRARCDKCARGEPREAPPAIERSAELEAAASSPQLSIVWGVAS